MNVLKRYICAVSVLWLILAVATASAASADCRIYVGLPSTGFISPKLASFWRATTMNETEPYPLWDNSTPVPAIADLNSPDGVEFSVIKPRVPEEDGYRWLHGVAIEWHEKKLYACYGHNKGEENTETEVANWQVSDDGGKTWSETSPMDHGTDEIAVSHGVLRSYGGRLHAFMGSFRDRRKDLHTRYYVLDEDGGKWKARGVVARDGFWPCQRPKKMDNGNWIMAGLIVGRGNPAGVAISNGDEFTEWNVIAIPKPDGMQTWGESAVIIDGSHIVNIARYGEDALALVSTSDDYGRTWTTMRQSNLPMTTSKPYAGTLSTGQRYLICTTTADCDGRRHPLTIAVSHPGKEQFCRIFNIRPAIHDGPGESHPNAALAYPYAIEHDGKLYVAYSNNGGRGHNYNSAELAVIPVSSLAVD